MVERHVCETGCVHPVYEGTLSDGTRYFAKPRMASNSILPPSEEHIQKLAENLFKYAKEHPEEMRRQTKEIIESCF